MAPYWGERFGNPHARENTRGWRATEALDEARSAIARTIGASPSEIVFTSGATEANNLAIAGAYGRSGTKRHIITSAIEHPSVLQVIKACANMGGSVSILPVCPDGRVDPTAVSDAIQSDTLLVSIQLANHEIGTLQPIGEIAEFCRARGVRLHVDAAQALGKMPIDVAELGADLMSFSAHKLYGPMGIGALYVHRDTPLEPVLHGGGQEGGLRSGTVPLPLAVGFAAACRFAGDDLAAEAERLAELRDRLLARLNAGIPELQVNGSMSRRLPGNLNITLPVVAAAELMLALPEIAMSSGAACASVRPEPSTVLCAIGLSVEETARSLRLGLGRFTTEAEIDEAADTIVRAWRRLN